MAIKLSPAGVIGKWVIAPVLLILLGYFVIGPRVGKSIEPKPKSSQNQVDGPTNADPPSADPPAATSHANGPTVDVTVHPASATEVASTHPHSSHRRRTRPTQQPATTEAPVMIPKPITTPPPDDGGSAGSTTAG